MQSTMKGSSVNSRRTVIIGAAVLLALLAFLGNVMYLKNAKESAYGKAKLVSAFVVAKDIPKGTQGDLAIAQAFVRAGEIPQEYHPAAAVTNLNDIRNKVAITDLYQGQIVVGGQFVDESVAQVTFAQRIAVDRTAVTVSVDSVHGVAGLLMPGDLVDVMAISSDENGGGSTVMYQNVKILAIGAKAAPQAGESSTSSSSKTATQTTADSGLITFEVPLAAAQRIALMSSGAGGYSIYLALVPPNNKAVEPIPAPVDLGNVLKNLPGTPY